MNLATIDLGQGSDAQAGDSVVLIGEESGEAVWANDMARAAGTIAYEILTAIDRTLPREYVGGESDWSGRP